MTDPIARRLPHVLTVRDLVTILVPTYSEALSVDEDEARDRLSRALAIPALAAEAYAALSAALHEARGVRTSQDAVVDKLSAGVQARRGRAKAAPSTPAISAVLVRVNLEIGAAPEQMRQTLASERGRAMLEAGWKALATHLVKDLLR